MSHSVVLDRIKDSPAVKWLDSAANNAVKWPGYGLGVLISLANTSKIHRGPTDLSKLYTSKDAPKGALIDVDRKGKTIFIKDKSGKVLYSAPMTSGALGYTDAEFESVKNKGVIPKGLYWIDPKTSYYENNPGNIRNFDYDIGQVSWGSGKLRLFPDKSTNTKGRDSFTIHGGGSPGSAGCIKITNLSDKDKIFIDALAEKRKTGTYSWKDKLRELGYKLHKNKIFNLEAPKHKDKPFKDFMDKVNQYFDGKSKIPVRVSKNDFVTTNLI